MVTIRDIEAEAERGCGVFDAAEQLRDYVYGLTEQAFERGKKRILLSVDEVEQWKATVKKQLLEAIGWQEGEKASPLNASITGTIRCEGYKIEKIIFQSGQQVWVSANLYLPEKGNQVSGNARLPAVLFVCGHDPQGKQAEEYQKACIYLVRAGLAVLIMDSCGQGERTGYYEEEIGRECVGRCTREHDYAGFQCMLSGDSVAKYLLRDAMRAVDYLKSRKEIDSEKIGITGNSGGGTLTMLMIVADERIAAAAPGTFVTDREAYLFAGHPQDNEQIWRGLSESGIDHKDCVLCMAPRPVLFLTATHDFFPRKGTEDTYNYCKKIWALYGEEKNLELFRDDCMHTYSKAMAIRAATFFATCFGIKLPDKAGLEKSDPDIKPERALWCTKSGYLQNEKNGKGLYEQNLEHYRNILKSRKPYRNDMEYFLKSEVYRHRNPGTLFLRKTRKTENVLNLLCDSYIWESQKKLINHGFLFRDNQERKNVIIALWRDGCKRLSEHYEWIRDTCRKGYAVLVLDITGMGMLEQRQFMSWPDKDGFYGAKYKLNADLLWLDDCLMALGCYDLLRSVEAIGQIPNLDTADVQFYTYGKYSLYGEIATFLNPEIKKVISEYPQESFGEVVEEKYYNPEDIASFVIPGILKYGDINDIRRWRNPENNRNQELEEKYESSSQ